MVDRSLLPHIVAAGEAAVHGSLEGEKTHILLSGKETGGAFALILDEAPPGGGPPLHIHHNEDETFHILEGTLTVQLNEERLTLLSGTIAFLPRGVPHTFANLGTEPVIFLGVVTPAGFEDLSAAVAPLTSEVEPDMAAIMALAAQYHVELVGPPLAADRQP
jgi:quercetin dioxygenase-like cupin family protein